MGAAHGAVLPRDIPVRRGWGGTSGRGRMGTDSAEDTDRRRPTQRAEPNRNLTVSCAQHTTREVFAGIGMGVIHGSLREQCKQKKNRYAKNLVVSPTGHCPLHATIS